MAGLLGAAPQRIVSTSPSITEILFALGLGDRVVGVTTYCRYPVEAQKLPKVGTFVEPHMETILRLKPDLVIIQTNPVRLRQRLEAVKLRVLEVSPVSMAGVHESIAAIAKAADVAQQGARLSASIRTQLEEVAKVTGALAKRKVAVIVGRTPASLNGLIAVGSGSYLAELFAVAGGENAFAGSRAAYPKVSHEEMLARNPDVIVDMAEMGDAKDGKLSEARKQEVIALWRKYPSLRAVQAGRVYAVADDRFVVPGPRMGEAAREFAKLLHPEARW